MKERENKPVMGESQKKKKKLSRTCLGHISPENQNKTILLNFIKSVVGPLRFLPCEITMTNANNLSLCNIF